MDEINDSDATSWNGGVTKNGFAGGDVFYDDGTGSDYGIVSNADPLSDGGTDSDVRGFTDKHRAAEHRAG
jgi:hypothetical protein